eukprot:scaffold52139_cov53-Attheya_sp.AAC.2
MASNGEASTPTTAVTFVVEDDASEKIESEYADATDIRMFECMTGMMEDIRARAPFYKDDWSRPKSILTVINATAFAFVVQLIPGLIFAELLDRETKGSLAVAETLLSAGIIGIIYALISGQPLVLLGITGPVAILLGTSYSLAEKFDADYWPFFFWLCMWTALLHFLTAVCGIVNFVWKITPFTTQIFEFFIAISFIFESVRDLVEPLHLRDTGEQYNEERGAGYATLLLGIATFYICWTLHFAETWVYMTRQVRTFLTSYNMAIAAIIVTALSYLPGVDQAKNGHGGIERVHVKAPWDWQPTDQNRSWVTNPLDGIGARGVFGALFPASMLYLLFFIDHNISSILTQAPKFNLKKPSAFHWDFFCLGVTIIPCAIMGLPPGSGLIPQAPLHTRALSTREHVMINGVRQEITTHVEEQRWSALFQAALMFLALALFSIIALIPKGALFGTFFYLGVGALHGNDIWAHLSLCTMLAKKRPNIPIVREVKWRTVQIFTGIQVACAGLIFGIAQFAEWGYVFPALVCACVPFSKYVLVRLFSKEDLKYLDPVGESEEEYLVERKEMHEAMRRPSIDSVDIALPGWSEFHAHRPDDHHPVEVQDMPTKTEEGTSTLVHRNVQQN